MNIFPAIDLYGGKAVRLFKGDYANMTVYSDHPIEVARAFEAAGAHYIHMVDLEGARDGGTPNLAVVAEVARETSLFVEIGGGIRDMATVEAYLAAGVSRVILGTAAVNDPAFLDAAIAAYGDKIAVGADVKDGYIAIKGWLEQSAYTLEAFLSEMQARGVRTVICTDRPLQNQFETVQKRSWISRFAFLDGRRKHPVAGLLFLHFRKHFHHVRR
ncbi:MAG: 1-(5-phosphoribosyl)-5-((5-phosphoribosylamino)methylideneamino)imidazole-4-carboxamide isomerase [Clostridia bacterium]|nr:1-(5-phosphoribosyl)-5-((5-phosphoribosylamino)methylideneamino)imidazole-4-carboxamide isomerase [Clostridia bacterium]